jgi:septum formation protein
LSLPPLVLASASPRRRELLLAAGLTCTFEPAQVDELDDPELGLAALVLANARAKALAVAGTRPGDIVLGADTLVWLDGSPLGKPTDTDAARRMLGELSGRVHEVATGIHLVRLEPRVQVEFHEVTRVRFRQLDAEVIGEYLRRVDVLDKAGAYALQEHGEMLVESVEGSRSNVVGLPMERVAAALVRHFGG